MTLTQNKLLIVFGALLLVVLFGWNSVLELRAEEPRRAIVAMEMLLRGEYWVPRINDWSYYNKPPLFNWWMAFFLSLFGSFEEWVVRLPSLVSYLLIAVFNFCIVQHFLNREIALFSSLFFLTAADLLFYGTVNAGEIDLFFSLLVYLQVISMFIFFERKKFFWLFLASYIFAALGTLTKGAPSIAFQGLTLIPWLLLNRQWRLLFSWKHFAGIGVYLLIVGGYFYQYANYDDTVGFMVHLFKEAAQRTGMEHAFLDTLKQSLVFPFYVAQLLAPWSILLLFFFRVNFLNTIRSNSLLLFCVVFLGFNLPLYWLSGEHKARYLYMFFPFFCMLLSYFFLYPTTQLELWKKRIEQLFLGVMILITLAFFAPPFIPQTRDIPFMMEKSALIILLGASLVFLYKKNTQHRLLIFIIFNLVARLGFNFTYLPATAAYSSRLIYRDHAKQVLAITKDEPIHWTGAPFTFESDASIGPFLLKQVKLTSAPLLAYQIPYYITKGNGHIMQYDTVLQANRYYLAHQSFIQKDSTEVLYRFPDKWVSEEVVLFKTE